MNWWIERLEEHKDSRAIIDVLSGREDSYSNILSMSKLLKRVGDCAEGWNGLLGGA